MNRFKKTAIAGVVLAGLSGLAFVPAFADAKGPYQSDECAHTHGMGHGMGHGMDHGAGHGKEHGEGHKKGYHKGSGKQAGYNGGALFKLIDADGDGAWSRVELTRFQGEAFNALDLDNNGVLSRAELMPPRDKPTDEVRQMRLRQLMATRDVNGDQAISRAELPQDAPLARRFEKLDTNVDGMLTADELMQMMKRSSGRGHDDCDGHEGHGAHKSAAQ